MEASVRHETAKRSKKGTPGWLAPAGLLLLSTGPLTFGAFRLIQLASGAEIAAAWARLNASPLPIILHISAAAMFAILGALQFSTALRRRHPAWHHVAGRVSVVAGVVVALSALWMTVFYPRPDGTGALLVAFRLVFASAMLASVVLSFAAVRRRDIRGHREWIARAYAIGLGAGTQMFTLAFTEIVAGPPGPNAIAFAHAAAWLINLAVAEWQLRKPRLRRTPRNAGRAAPLAEGGRA